MIEAHEETITKMESHSRDYADEISDLSNALEEEHGHSLALEESHNDGHAKLKKDLDHALVVSCVLTSEKAKLGVDHARLKEECRCQNQRISGRGSRTVRLGGW